MSKSLKNIPFLLTQSQLHMINLDEIKVSKHLHTSLMTSFGVLDPQFVPSNRRQDKIVKQNTFVLHSDE